MKLLARTLICSIAAIAAPVAAQSYFPNIQVSDFPDPVVGNSSEVSGYRPVSAQPVRRPPSSAATLDYRPSQAVRKQNVARMVAEQRKMDPEAASKTEAFFASTDMIEQIDRMMRPMGLRANNVGDAYTLWWVIAWHAANGRQGEPDRATMTAVKRQAENALLSTPQISSASNELKQEMAEAFLVQAALIDASNDEASGNPAKVSALAKAVNKGARQVGLDLTKMTLTPDGFVPRSGGRSDAGDAAGDNSQLAANDGTQADSANMGNYALYAVAGTGLLAGMFALGKGFSKKG